MDRRRRFGLWRSGKAFGQHNPCWTLLKRVCKLVLACFPRPWCLAGPHPPEFPGLIVPSHHQRFDFTYETERRMSPPTFPPSTHASLKENGVWGAKFNMAEGEYEVFDNWPELIGLIGDLMAGSRAQQGA